MRERLKSSQWWMGTFLGLGLLLLTASLVWASEEAHAPRPCHHPGQDQRFYVAHP